MKLHDLNKQCTQLAKFNLFNIFDHPSYLGTANRTVASTQMNATSSRAHTVVTIQFDQIEKNAAGEETKKSSVINLVDLAGKNEFFFSIF